MKPKLIAMLVLLGLAAASLGACAGLPFSGGFSWKEEVLLHDGGTLIVERWIKRGPGGRHEIGQPPSITEGVCVSSCRERANASNGNPCSTKPSALSISNLFCSM